MADVPSQFISGVRPQVAPLAQPGPDGGAILGEGIARAGQTISQADQLHGDTADRLAALQYQQDVQRQSAAASVAFAQLRTGMATAVDDLRTNAAPGGAGHVAAVKSAYDPQVESLMNGITNPDVRQHMLEQVAQYGAELSTTESHWQTQQTNLKMVGDVQQASDLSANLARTMTDPAKIATELQRGAAEIQTMPIGADLREKLTHSRVSTVLGSAIQGATDRGDTGLARQLVGSDVANQYLKPQEVEVLSRGIGVEDRRQAAQAREQQALADKAVREQVSTDVVQIGQGIQVPDARLAADQAARVRMGDTSGAQEIAGLRAKSAINAETQPWSPQQFQGRIDALAAKGTGRSPEEDVELTQLRAIAPARIAQIREHPYAWAASNGHPPAPLNITDPASVVARQQLQSTIQQQTGMRPGLLTDDEAAPLKEKWQLGEKGRVDVINQLAGLGASAALDALHQVAPADAQARRLVVLPQSYRAAAVDGAAARKQDRNLVDAANVNGQPIGPGRKIVDAFNRYVGPAMMLLDPADKAAALDTAKSIQASYQFHSGAGYNDGQFYTSLHQALGGTRDSTGAFRGGLGAWHDAPVVLPDGVTGDQFQQHMANLHWSDAWAKSSQAAPVFRGGQPMTADQVKSGYHPVIQPDGRYRFMGPPVAGSQQPSVLYRRDGQVWTVRIDAGGLHP